MVDEQKPKNLQPFCDAEDENMVDEQERTSQQALSNAIEKIAQGQKGMMTTMKDDYKANEIFEKWCWKTGGDVMQGYWYEHHHVREENWPRERWVDEMPIPLEDTVKCTCCICWTQVDVTRPWEPWPCAICHRNCHSDCAAICPDRTCEETFCLDCVPAHSPCEKIDNYAKRGYIFPHLRQ